MRSVPAMDTHLATNVQQQLINWIQFAAKIERTENIDLESILRNLITLSSKYQFVLCEKAEFMRCASWGITGVFGPVRTKPERTGLFSVR